MAASKHLGIRDAVAALYQASTALAGGRIDENRELSLSPEEASRVSVYRVDSAPLRELVGSTAPIDWLTQIRTVVKARKSGATSAEAVADDIACACYARVMAAQTLGGLAQELDPGPITWDQQEGESNVAVITWDITVRHRTDSNTIT